MNQALTGVTVLVTRPKHQSKPLCVRIEQAGGTAICFPVITICALPLDPVIKQTLQNPIHTLIFISSNAAYLGLPAIRALNPRCLEQSQIAAIGQATAKQLKAQGLNPQIIAPSPYNSEALLSLPQMRSLDGQHLALIKGKGGRDYLTKQLQKRGGVVSEIPVYVRVKPKPRPQALKPFIQAKKAVALITSVKGLDNLMILANPQEQNWLKTHGRFLVPSQRVADAVYQLPAQHPPIIADNATDDAMLARLCLYFQ